MEYKEFKKLNIECASENFTLNLEDIKNILELSNEYEDYSYDIDESLEEGKEVRVLEDKFKGLLEDVKVYKTSVNSWILITTVENFKSILNNAGIEYLNDRINDFLEPYFNEDKYLKDLFDDDSLRQVVLYEGAEIEKHEFVTYQGKEYVIFEK